MVDRLNRITPLSSYIFHCCPHNGVFLVIKTEHVERMRTAIHGAQRISMLFCLDAYYCLRLEAVALVKCDRLELVWDGKRSHSAHQGLQHKLGLNCSSPLCLCALISKLLFNKGHLTGDLHFRLFGDTFLWKCNCLYYILYVYNADLWKYFEKDLPRAGHL